MFFWSIFQSRSISFGDDIRRARSRSIRFLTRIVSPALIRKQVFPKYNPSKSAVDYWLGVNKTILGHSKSIFELWQDEKIAATESIEIAKTEGLKYLSSEREKIMRMSHNEELKTLVKSSKIESKIAIINKISDNGLFAIK